MPTETIDESWYEKDRVLIERALAGASQSDIARELGLTRERVRQRLKRHGIEGRNYRWVPDREKVLAALSTTGSFMDAAESIGLNRVRFRTAISFHGLDSALADAQKRWRIEALETRHLASQRPLLIKVRALALQVLHTPTADELRSIGIHHVELNRIFGSVPNAMRAAGLTPNVTGRPPMPLPPDFWEPHMPTADAEEAQRRGEQLRRILDTVPEPVGSEQPTRTEISTTVYYRDPQVVAWVLQAADGTCEACGERGYETDMGVAYLEVHHVVALSDGGPDTIWNTVGVCETCHGKLHRWNRRAELEAFLYASHPRLRRHGESAAGTDT